MPNLTTPLIRPEQKEGLFGRAFWPNTADQLSDSSALYSVLMNQRVLASLCILFSLLSLAAMVSSWGDYRVGILYLNLVLLDFCVAAILWRK